MRQTHTKDTAEAVLRELPSVLGACVREDVAGRPREVHLLVRDGPNVRDLARDVRALLEERLGMVIDQRIISIAQLAADASLDTTSLSEEMTAQEPPADANAGSATNGSTADADAVRAGPVWPVDAPREPESRTIQAPSGPPPTHAHGLESLSRAVYAGLETHAAQSRISVKVRLAWQGTDYVGEASEVDAGQGRVRAAALATVRAATAACRNETRLELDAASLTRALERDYALVSVIAVAPWLGRRPVVLCGAHPVEGDDVMAAAALAVLKATNRILELAMGEPARGPRFRG